MSTMTSPVRNLTDKAKDAATFVGQKADDATAAVGGGLKSLGQTIRDKGGTVNNASAAVAQALENSGNYLQEQGVKGIGNDVTNLIRRNPIPAVLLGIGVGFLLARKMMPRS